MGAQRKKDAGAKARDGGEGKTTRAGNVGHPAFAPCVTSVITSPCYNQYFLFENIRIGLTLAELHKGT